MAKGNDVTVKEDTSVAAVPDFMKNHAGKGTENLSNEDVGLPRIALMQAISQQVVEGLARPGEFYHLLADTALSKELHITPIVISKSYMLWNPRDQGGGILARADDGVHWAPSDCEFNVKINNGSKSVVWRTAETVELSGLDKFGSFDPDDAKSPPAATKMMNVLVWIHEYPELSPVVLTLQRSGLKNGKKFLGRLKMSEAPIFGQKFKLGTEVIQGPKGTYHAPTFVGAGFVEQALFTKLEEMYNHFSKAGIKVNEKGLDEEGGGQGNDDVAESTKF